MLTAAQEYPQGVELFAQGAVLEDVFHIESGIVKLVHTDRSGEETIVTLAFRGAWLGTAAALIDLPSPVTAVTCTSASLERIAAKTFCDRLASDPDLSRRVHVAHARELCRQTGWMAELGSRSSRERLERVITQLILALGIRRSPRGIRLQPPLRHWEIAQLIAVTPEHLSRILRQMEDDGVIRREKGCMVVRDPRRLCSTCELKSTRWCERAAAEGCLSLNQNCG